MSDGGVLKAIFASAGEKEVEVDAGSSEPCSCPGGLLRPRLSAGRTKGAELVPSLAIGA
jgi:hypothetical protein